MVNTTKLPIRSTILPKLNSSGAAFVSLLFLCADMDEAVGGGKKKRVRRQIKTDLAGIHRNWAFEHRTEQPVDLQVAKRIKLCTLVV